MHNLYEGFSGKTVNKIPLTTNDEDSQNCSLSWSQIW